MARIAKTVATLRFFGDDLDPDEITRLLGCQPTTAERKGGLWTTKRGVEKISPRGSWRLEADDCVPGNLDVQIEYLFSKLISDLNVWNDLAKRLQADVFCGLFLDEANEGLALEPKTLAALGERNLVLGLDIYSEQDGED